MAKRIEEAGGQIVQPPTDMGEMVGFICDQGLPDPASPPTPEEAVRAPSARREEYIPGR